MKRRRKNPAKFERCVKDVKKSLRHYKRRGNAYAICNAAELNKNPHWLKAYWLRAQSKGYGPIMYYIGGHEFSDSGTPVSYKLWWTAMKALQRLKREYPLLKKYNLAIVGPNGVTLTNPKNRDLSRAATLLKNFSGHEPEEVLNVKEKDFRAGLAVGSVLGIAYQTVRDGQTEDYMHEFRSSSRPLLAASSDGKSLRIVGGRFQFTEAGIEDR